MVSVLDAAYSKPREFVLDPDYPRVELDATDLAQLDASYPALADRIERYFTDPPSDVSPRA